LSVLTRFKAREEHGTADFRRRDHEGMGGSNVCERVGRATCVGEPVLGLIATKLVPPD
jgi:hypothetical protein